MSAPVERILVVDDEYGIREGCRKVLTLEGFEVETAADGIEGLEIFRAHRNFSAALIDLKMPRMGGLELIDAIRSEDRDILMLVITAYATIQTAVQATKKGAYGYIPKPFTPDELLLPVKKGLEMRALSLEARRLREERERRLLQVAAEQSKCRTIIDCMTDGVVVVNRDRQIVLENAALARFIPDAHTPSVPAPMDKLDCAELTDIIEESLNSQTGPLISSKEVALGDCTYMVNASPVLEPNQDISGAVAVVRDITALKQLAVAKSMFISMVAHEIKSPLAAIEAFLDLASSQPDVMSPEKKQEMMERCATRARTLRNMVSELLNLVAMETGRFAIKRIPLDLRQMIDEVVELQRSKASQRQIDLTVDLPRDGDSVEVMADREAMTCVLTNLVDNAIKYTPEGGHVEVALTRTEHGIRIAVSDDGIGMTDMECDRSFDEFFRAKNEQTAVIPGTGLGLSVVKRLVEMHNGTVMVQSERGKGSTFTLSLQPHAQSSEGQS